MKSKKDPRHQRRIDAVKELFSHSFLEQKLEGKLSNKVLSEKHLLDEKIKKAAPSWPIENLNKVDLAILRLAVYELLNETAPPKVIIDEAVELAKKFGSEKSPSFVNGVLGTIYKNVEESKNGGK